jgi:hypothetical protein
MTNVLSCALSGVGPPSASFPQSCNEHRRINVVCARFVDRRTTVPVLYHY